MRRGKPPLWAISYLSGRPRYTSPYVRACHIAIASAIAFAPLAFIVVLALVVGVVACPAPL